MMMNYQSRRFGQALQVLQRPGASSPYSIYVPPYPMLYDKYHAKRLDKRIRSVYKTMSLPCCALPMESEPPSNHVIQYVVAEKLGISRKHVKIVREQNYKGLNSSRLLVLVRGPYVYQMERLVNNSPITPKILKGLLRCSKEWYRLCYAGKGEHTPKLHSFSLFKEPDDEQLYAYISVALLSYKHDGTSPFLEYPLGKALDEIKYWVECLIRQMPSEMTVLESNKCCNGHEVRKTVNKLCKSMSVTPHGWKGSKYIHSYLGGNRLHRAFLNLMTQVEKELPGTVKIHCHQSVPEVELMQNYVGQLSDGIDECMSGVRHCVYKKDDGLFNEITNADVYEGAAQELNELAATMNQVLKQAKELKVAKRIHTERLNTAMGCGSALWTHR